MRDALFERRLRGADIVGAVASTTPIDTSVTTDTDSATSADGVVLLSGTQVEEASSSTLCQNVSNSNSTLNFTPSVGSGIAIIAEWNAEGPECGMSGTNNQFDSIWFEGEDDSCCGALDSSSGHAHIPYAGASLQTSTFNWANNLASGASGYGMMIVPFKAAVGSTAAPKMTLLGVGP